MHRASRYEPDINRTYHDLAAPYGTAVLPARPRSPQDKAKVEAAVQNVGRWVLAPLRNHRFFSLCEVREAIKPLLAALNERPFQKAEGSRRSLLEDLDRPALKPLPAGRYQYAEWRKARVNIDYHIRVDGHLYSVPHALRGDEVESGSASRQSRSSTSTSVWPRPCPRAPEGRLHDASGASARRAPRPPRVDPVAPHPLGAKDRAADRCHHEEAPREPSPHPEQGHCSCLGLMRLVGAYPAERMEAACRRALKIGTLSYKSVKSILSTGLDQTNPGEQHSLDLPDDHAHVRGPDYYANPHNGKET